MTISTTNSRNTFTGDGVTTTFDFTFKVNTTTPNVGVTVSGVLLDTGFSIQPYTNQSTSPGGLVVFGVPPALNSIVEFDRGTPQTQNYGPPVEGKISTTALGAGLDAIVMMVQEIEQQIDDLSLSIGQQNFVWMGPWNSTTAYLPGQAVSFDGITYVALVANTNNIPPTVNWMATGPQGIPGATGAQGLPGLGNVNGPVASVIGDVAIFNGATGSLLADSGIAAAGIVQGPGLSTANSLALWNGTTGVNLKDGLAGVNNGDTPQWNLATSKWVAAQPTAATGGSPLKAAMMTVTGNALPTFGSISGVYTHVGNWTQTGTIQVTGPTFIYGKGVFTFLGTTSVVGCIFPHFGGQTAASSTANPKAAFGLGAPAVQNVGVTTGNPGGAGGGFGGAGGNGGSTTAGVNQWGGQAYNWRESFSSSSGGAGAGSVYTSSGNGGGAPPSIYLEVSGSIVVPSTVGTSPFNFSGNAGNAASAASGGGGGGAAGAAIIFRCDGTINLGASTAALLAAGGAGGSAASTAAGSGAGGGGGHVDVQCNGVLTAAINQTGCVPGGAAGTGGSTVNPPSAGGSGTFLATGGVVAISCF